MIQSELQHQGGNANIIDSAEHDLFLDLYADLGIPADFYWFTLSAAPADGMHYMSEEEILRFNLLTDGKVF